MLRLRNQARKSKQTSLSYTIPKTIILFIQWLVLKYSIMAIRSLFGSITRSIITPWLEYSGNFFGWKIRTYFTTDFFASHYYHVTISLRWEKLIWLGMFKTEKPYHFLPNTSCRRTVKPRWQCLRGCTWPARGRAWDGPWLRRSRRRWCRTRWWRCCGRSTWRSSSKCRRGRGRSRSGGRSRTTT